MCVLCATSQERPDERLAEDEFIIDMDTRSQGQMEAQQRYAQVGKGVGGVGAGPS